MKFSAEEKKSSASDNGLGMCDSNTYLLFDPLLIQI